MPEKEWNVQEALKVMIAGLEKVEAEGLRGWPKDQP